MIDYGMIIVIRICLICMRGCMIDYGMIIAVRIRVVGMRNRGIDHGALSFIFSRVLHCYAILMANRLINRFAVG